MKKFNDNIRRDLPIKRIKQPTTSIETLASPRPLGSDLSSRIADHAARLICEEHIHDIAQARQKAAQALDVSAPQLQPSAEQILRAVHAYRQLFNPEQEAELLSLRRKALQLMIFFERYQPWLTGSVLHGTADRHSNINLLVFLDDPKALEIFLLNQGIEYQIRTSKTAYRDADSPTLVFWYDDSEVCLQVLPVHAQNNAGKRAERMRTSQLQALISQYAEGKFV